MHRRAQLILLTAVGGLASSVPHHDGRQIGYRQTGETPVIYKNASYSIDERVEDLLQRMTVEEKAGQMFHTQLNMPTNYSLVDGSASDILITRNLISHFNLVGNILDAGKVAEYVNEAQRRAVGGRLGIPITLSS